MSPESFAGKVAVHYNKALHLTPRAAALPDERSLGVCARESQFCEARSALGAGELCRYTSKGKRK